MSRSVADPAGTSDPGQPDPELDNNPGKLAYEPPRLVVYGSVGGLTLSVGQSGTDNSMNPSQMRL